MTPLVMMNNIRSPNFPDVPLLSETGYHGAPSRSWYGLFTPPARRGRSSTGSPRRSPSIVGNPGVPPSDISPRAAWLPAINTPEEFAEAIAKDRTVAEQVVKDAGIEPQ